MVLSTCREPCTLQSRLQSTVHYIKMNDGLKPSRTHAAPVRTRSYSLHSVIHEFMSLFFGFCQFSSVHLEALLKMLHYDISVTLMTPYFSVYASLDSFVFLVHFL